MPLKSHDETLRELTAQMERMFSEEPDTARAIAWFCRQALSRVVRSESSGAMEAGPESKLQAHGALEGCQATMNARHKELGRPPGQVFACKR